MDNNMTDLLANVQKMIDSGNLPSNIQETINNANQNVDINNILNNISPEMLDNFKNLFEQSNHSTGNNSSNNNNTHSNINNNNSQSHSSTEYNNKSSTQSGIPNIDVNTILRMKSVIDQMNTKDDPRANLLYSLKPYLRDSKKEKIDQCVNLLNMTKIADIMNSENKNGKNKQD